MNKCQIMALCALLSTGAMAQSDSGEFYRAIRDNHLDALRSLLRSGDVNVRGKFQSTPLHTDAAIGSVESIRMLVEGGAEVNAKTQHGTAPLTIAAYRSGFSPVVRMLPGDRQCSRSGD